MARGTDYNAGPAFHPIQPTAEMVIKDAKIIMKEKNLNKVFLATEDSEIYTKFKEQFGRQLVTVECPRYTGTERITQRRNNRKRDKYIQGLDYITSIYVLARCECLLAGNTNGSIGAGVINGGRYEYVKIYSLGLYPST